jgi:hypothetical protein
MANIRKAQIEKQKPKNVRVPLGRRNVLTVRGLEDQANFHYHFFNDVDDRLYQCLEGGYEFVPKEGVEVGDQTVESARGTESVVKKGVGRGIVAYLMRIPIELYEQDQRMKAALVDESEAGVKNPKVDGAYGKVSIETKDKA